MESKTFKKQKLNKKDHKKVDDVAKNVRNGIGAVGTLVMVVPLVVKAVPKVMKNLAKL